MTEDDELMSRLRRIAERVDPVPELVIDGARAALLTRRLDERLAELLLDSSLESGQVRGGQEQVRLLSFQRGSISLEVKVEYLGAEVSLHGLVDGTSGAVHVERGGEHRSVPIDEEGEFTVSLPRGAVRFRLGGDGGTAVTTGWLLL